MRPTAKEQAAVQAMLAAQQEARDSGRDYFKQSPDEMLVTIARYAAMAYGDDINRQIAFLQGYIGARQQRDAWQEDE
jgi:hypothetical protein